MSHSGQRIDNPPMRSRIVFRKTAAETNGEFLEFDFFIEPGGTIARAHRHPRQDERFEVIAGRVRGRVRDEERTADTGDVVEMPRGVPHLWWNDGDVETHLRVRFRPALDTETFFETAFGLARDGKTGPNGIPRPLQLAVLLAAHPGEFCPAAVPIPVLKLFVAVFAPIGRMLGYRARYPQYSDVMIETTAPAAPSPR